MLRSVGYLFFAISFSLILCSCNTKREFVALMQNGSNAKLLAEEPQSLPVIKNRDGDKIADQAEKRGSYNDFGENRIIMNAIVENGEYISVDTLRSVRITASYRPIAERGGFIDIPFNILVPAALLDKNWQLRLTPKLFWGKDSLLLDGILITGVEYKNEQMRGLERYRKFVESVVTNPDDYLEAFGYLRLIETFCARNVDRNIFGVSRKEAEEYYINHWLMNHNDKKIRQLGEKYKQWCASFETNGGMRLDTIITSSDGNLIYKYLQKIRYKRQMNKIKVAFDGVLCSVTKQQYPLPQSDTLYYNITSVAQFTSFEPLFIDKVIERRVTMESSAYINFEVGKWDVIDTLANNATEIEKIKGLFDGIAEGGEFEIDSIIITANCSPEGVYASNSLLARKRSESIRDYLGMQSLKDKKLINKYQSEDWESLQKALLSDSLVRDKAYLIECYKISDLDKREKEFSSSPDYNYIKENIYPLLRRIDILFALHRKGMVKDTIHTQEPDYNYLKAIEALQDRDYDKAASLMRGYKCLNNAIALIGLERNLEALSILNSISESPNVSYLKAIAYTRTGKDEKAIMMLDDAVRGDESLAFRIRLDPEINDLATRYGKDYTNTINY